MEALQALVAEVIHKQRLTQAVLSNLHKKGSSPFKKVKVSPITIKGDIKYQFTYHFEQKVQHENVFPSDAEYKLLDLLQTVFKQAVFNTKDADYQVLMNKKMEAAILKKQPTKTDSTMSHNRKKHYLLEEGTPVPFLIELGVMSADGEVFAKKHDKFRQINRFLEMVDDVLPALKQGGTLNIVDFGCGKAYLTFALYHYLRYVKQYNLRVIGLDLKEDVIRHCNGLAERLRYDELQFRVGDISNFTELEQVDMVVTLHACDTATDAALEKAVRWGADVILSVPCCQHELFTQVDSAVLTPMLEHGIIKERFSALATDAIRAKLLELLGYKTQILEFIDLEHTPKNLLIRAVKQSNIPARRNLAQAYITLREFLGVQPYFERALRDKLEPILALVHNE